MHVTGSRRNETKWSYRLYLAGILSEFCITPSDLLDFRTRAASFTVAYRSCVVSGVPMIFHRVHRSCVRLACDNLRAISHDPMRIRAAHAICIFGIECPRWGENRSDTPEGHTRHFLVQRARAASFHRCLPVSFLVVIASCMTRSLSFSRDRHGG